MLAVTGVVLLERVHCFAVCLECLVLNKSFLRLLANDAIRLEDY